MLTTYRMRDYTGQMSRNSLVNGEQTFSLDRFLDTVKDAVVKVAALVVHSGHNSVGRVHGNTNNDTTDSTAGKVKWKPLFHPEMAYQVSLGKKVCR